MVLLGRRAQRVISQINATAKKLRHELLEDVSPADLRTCVRVLTQINEKAERKNGNGALAKNPVHRKGHVKNEHRARGRASRRG